MSPTELDALAKELYETRIGMDWDNATGVVRQDWLAVARWVHRRTRLAQREAWVVGGYES